MTRYGFLGAVALAASALASPAMAQQVIYNPGYCAQFYPGANCQNLGPGNPYTGGYQQRAAYQQNRWKLERGGGWNNSYNRRDNGNPYAGGYQRRAAYQQNTWNGGWNNSYNRWDTGNPYTGGYQQSAAYQPYAAGTTATTAGTMEIRTPAVISSAPPTSRPAGPLWRLDVESAARSVTAGAIATAPFAAYDKATRAIMASPMPSGTG